MSMLFRGIVVVGILCANIPTASEVLAATPVVSTVLGNVATGQVITISGANMVNEDTANWDSFFSTNIHASGFEGSSYTSDGYGCVNCPNDNGTGRNWLPVYDTAVKLMGSQSLKFHVEYIDTAAMNITSYTNMSPTLSRNDIWLRFYVRWNTNFLNNSHLKMFDTMGGTYQTYIQPYPKLGGLYTIYNGGFSACDPPPAKGTMCDYPVSFDVNRWYVIEVHYNEGTVPYTIQVYKDGALITTGTQNSSVNWKSALLGIINTRIQTAGGWMDHWWDGFAISSTRIYPASKVEISDNPTYGSGTTVYQEPIYLSDGSIEVKVDLSGLAKGPLYLWVTNNVQQRSNPYALGSALSPPTGLSAQ